MKTLGGKKMANITETKEIITGQVEKLKKSVQREVNYFKEMENDKALLEHIEELMESGETIPAESPYESFAEWKEAVEKQIKAGESSLRRIDTEKAEIIAFEYFIANAQDSDTGI